MIQTSSKQYKTTNWSGGQTTELFIHPQGSTFKELDFKYRISIATIQISSSDFTPLPDVSRTLLLLEGELKLIHENHHESFLMPFSQDKFHGSWSTHSIGIAKDFNLMTKPGYSGTIEVITNNISFNPKGDHILIYNYNGYCRIDNIQLLTNDLVVFQDELTHSISIETDGHVIVVQIKIA